MNRIFNKVINKMGDQYNPLEIRIHGNYFTYDNELYDICFPKEWATNHEPGTGPKECNDCIKSGHWRGVFIGYCVNCSEKNYNYNRGGGFICRGVENKNAPFTSQPFKTYLGGATWKDIGDIDFNPGDVVNANKLPIISDAERLAVETFNKTELEKQKNISETITWSIDHCRYSQ